MKRTNMRNMWVMLVACIGLSVMSVSASAAVIQGAIGFGGFFTPTGGAGNDLSDATGIDLGFSMVTAASGDFAPAMNLFASFNHLDFAPANTPVTPLWVVNAGAISYSFDLHNISLDLQETNLLNLSGSGVLMATGFDDTLGRWTFSGQQGNIFFTFSSITAVAEPATLLLLGLGLLGIAGLRRRQY